VTENNPTGLSTRRSFLQYLAMLAVGGKTLLEARNARAAADAAVLKTDPPSGWPAMPRKKLGRTGFDASRLVFGCGAALSGGRNDTLLNAAFEAGINVFDVGSSTFYGPAESNLAPFLKTHRDKVFLISKAMVGLDINPDDDISVAQTRTAAATWSERLDESLRDLGVDRVDAYYLMASNNPTIVGSEEIYNAFEKAKKAGKVSHLGLSTHQNAEKVLETAIGSGWYSLAMTAITPAGWYSWVDKGILDDGKAMTDLEPFLARVRASGIGLVGMKAGRYLAGRKYFGWKNPDAFDEHYDEKQMASELSAFQRSYAYVLAHGMDVVNADMQSMAHLKENVVAVASSAKMFA
jgi:aryl-alcohol dehydrogenase-like predicted oxidoreductase